MSTATAEPVMTEAEYHAHPALSQTAVKDFLASRQLFYRRHIVRDPLFAFPGTDSTCLGTWLHAWILERDADIGRMDLVTIPTHVLSASGAKAGNKYYEWADKQTGDIVKASEVQERLEMLAAIQRNRMASALLLQPHPEAIVERPIFWEHEGHKLRCKPDKIIPGVAITDLKTTADASEWAIRKTIRTYKYDTQAAVYQRAWFAESGEWLPFVIVWHETTCPWRCVVKQFGPLRLERCWREFGKALNDIRECRETNDWREPADKLDTVEVIEDREE